MIQLNYFTAAWCQPCKGIKPIVARVASEYQVSVTEIDVDHFGSTAEQYNISSVPSVLFLVDQQPVTTLSGTKVTYTNMAQVLEGLGLHRTKT